MTASRREPVISSSWLNECSFDNSREFLALVELWCPAKSTGNTARKPHPPRKVSDKRDSISTEERKVREKPSWFRSGSNAASTKEGSWRPARCKLVEEQDRCMLNIYVEEAILQHSIYVHLLRCTDIRPVDRSLFLRKDCLSIHVKPGQRWLDSKSEEIIYVNFRNWESLNTWIALLRSYAVAEIYGRNHAPSDGGLYRMWRQVQFGVNQARNLGSVKLPSDVLASPMQSDYDGANEGTDMEVSCEIVINEVSSAWTTTKKCTGSPEWHELFTFSDLPPFGDMFIHVYREKKISKPQLLGSASLSLSNFRRGETIDAWFPLISSNQSVSGTQTGEIRLKIRVDEEIVLPTESYKSILQCMSKGNLLDLLHTLEQDLKLDHIAENVLAIAVVRDVLMRDLFELAEREVGGTSSSQNTLFRGNSVLTKTMEQAMNWFGNSFLEASVGPSVRQLIADKVVIEVDPIRSGKGVKDQEKNFDLLVNWCAIFWKNIYAAREECPQELRRLFQHIRQVVEKKFEQGHPNRNLRWQSVSAFCFLRFIVPAILHPHVFGLCDGMPPPQIQRSLTLIAKVLQSLANLNSTMRKEEFMKGVKVFMSDSLPAMIDYIKEVSTPLPDNRKGLLSPKQDEDDRLHVMNALQERKPTMPTLHREALLFLPHLLDIPRHLAVLSSAVVRSTRSHPGGSVYDSTSTLGIFIQSCLEVENQALKCVSQLRPRSHIGRPYPAEHAHQQAYSRVDVPSPSKHDKNSEDTGKKRMEVGLRLVSSSGTGRPLTAPNTPDPDMHDEDPWGTATNTIVAANVAYDNLLLPSSPISESSSSRYPSRMPSSTIPLSVTNTRRSASLDKAEVRLQQQRSWKSGSMEDRSSSPNYVESSVESSKRRKRLFGFIPKK